MKITNEWLEVTLSTFANYTTIQNKTGNEILLQEALVEPTDDTNAVFVGVKEEWTCVHDTRKLYVRGLYLADGEEGDIAIV